MSKSINILDTDYIQWIKELSLRYRRSQIKAAVKVNQEMLQFYWELGKDIMKNFYLLYQPYITITPRLGEQITQQVVERFVFFSFTVKLVPKVSRKAERSRSRMQISLDSLC